MKCSLKDGFIGILLLICITPTKGIELFLHKRSVLDKQMNLQQFRASINRLQDLDSFPENGNNLLHKIVKKQMANSDYKDGRKSKRSVAGFPGQPSGFRGGAGDGAHLRCKDGETAENAVRDLEVLKSRSTDPTDSTVSFLRKLKEFAREKDSLFIKMPRQTETHENKGQHTRRIKEEATKKKKKNVEYMLRKLKEKFVGKQKVNNRPLGEVDLMKNPCLTKHYTRFPDKVDCRFYYECESNSSGCLKLKHKRCPRGQFFSNKYLKCLNLPKNRDKKSCDPPFKKKMDFPETGTDDSEPSNEWLDANGSNQKIPPEFKPKKKPKLKIYHLRPKRRLDGMLGGEVAENRHPWAASPVAAHQQAENANHDRVKNQGTRHQLPRSYVIRVNKKEDQITENDENENDNDEEDDETDDEDDDEEADDEDDDGEEDDPKEVTQEKHEVKGSIREFLKSAKEAVTNRARFEDPIEISMKSSSSSKASSVPSKNNSSLKSKKSYDSAEGKDKKVLIDANIKVDSTISSVLKSFLKGKRKDKDAANGLTDDYETLAGLRTRDPVELKGPALYEHLMQNNPRVKRYYLANCAERGN